MDIQAYLKCIIMRGISINKLLYIIIAGVFLFVFVFFFRLNYKAYKEKLVLKKQEARLEERVKYARDILEAQSDYVRKMNRDPLFFEWVARQRLGYGTGDEIIFRFDAETKIKEVDF